MSRDMKGKVLVQYASHIGMFLFSQLIGVGLGGFLVLTEAEICVLVRLSGALVESSAPP